MQGDSLIIMVQKILIRLHKKSDKIMKNIEQNYLL